MHISIFRTLCIFGMALSLGCCGPNSNSKRHHHFPDSVNLTDWPTGEVVQDGVCEITLPLGIDPIRRDRLLNDVSVITSAWQHDEGILLPTNIGITDIEPGCCNNGVYIGGNYGGCWRGGSYVIVNTTNDTCANLYHELAHRTYQLYGHSDPRWTNWQNRVQDLYLLLRNP